MGRSGSGRTLVLASAYIPDWVPDTPLHFSAAALIAGNRAQTQEKKPLSELGESFDIWNRLEKIENCPYLSRAGFAMVTDCLIGSYISFHFSIWFHSLVCNSLHPCWAGIRGHLRVPTPGPRWRVEWLSCDVKSPSQGLPLSMLWHEEWVPLLIQGPRLLLLFQSYQWVIGYAPDLFS